MKNPLAVFGNLPPISLPDRTQAGVSAKDDAELMKLSKEFESILISQMMKVMRAGIPSDGVVERGFGEDVFTEMLDYEYAKGFAENNANGIWQTLYRQVSGKK